MPTTGKGEAIIKNLRKMHEGGSSLLLLLLLLTDLVFLILHVVNRLIPFESVRMFRVDIDGSYPELYQYIKFFWIIVLLAYLTFSKKHKHYISWLMIFGYFLVDDLVQIHEKGGRVIGDLLGLVIELNLPAEMRPRDLGELIIFAIVGFFLLGLLAWTYIRGPRTFRKVSIDLLILLAVFVFFAIAFDLLHVTLNLGEFMNALLAMIEDGGEMLVGSLFLWYVFLVTLWNGEPQAYLHEGFARWSGDGSKSGVTGG